MAATIWIDGPDESLKAAWLAELRHVWAAGCPEAPAARVFRAAESGWWRSSPRSTVARWFTPRELIVVLEIEDLGRSEKKIAALGDGLARPSGGSTFVLVESSSDTQRKALEPLRTVCEARLTASPLGRLALIEWGKRRLARAGTPPRPVCSS
jgi:hypothetical protein